MTNQRSSLPLSDYLSGLTLQVQRQLQKAVDNAPQRAEILHQLFTDVALEVDQRAQERLYASNTSGDAVVGRQMLCFYELIAQQYLQASDDAKAVLPLFVRLWSQSFASQIFALLFYKWLFEGPARQENSFLRYSTAFIEGAANVFWIDVQSDTRRFFSLYHYTFEEVAIKSACLEKLPPQAQKDITLLVSRFLFFYESSDKLGLFLHDCPVFLSCAMGNPADIFVTELTDQLRRIKVEPVLLRYLRSTKSLKGLELRSITSMRLKSALYSFTAPGGPMYPTREVRSCAWDTLDCLFPVGRNLRHLISFFFRLLHPYYWSISFWNFIVALLSAILQKVLAVLRHIWHWILATIQDHRQD